MFRLAETFSRLDTTVDRTVSCWLTIIIILRFAQANGAQSEAVENAILNGELLES